MKIFTANSFHNPMWAQMMSCSSPALASVSSFPPHTVHCTLAHRIVLSKACKRTKASLTRFQAVDSQKDAAAVASSLDSREGEGAQVRQILAVNSQCLQMAHVTSARLLGY